MRNYIFRRTLRTVLCWIGVGVIIFLIAFSLRKPLSAQALENMRLSIHNPLCTEETAEYTVTDGELQREIVKLCTTAVKVRTFHSSGETVLGVTPTVYLSFEDEEKAYRVDMTWLFDTLDNEGEITKVDADVSGGPRILIRKIQFEEGSDGKAVAEETGAWVCRLEPDVYSRLYSLAAEFKGEE